MKKKTIEIISTAAVIGLLFSACGNADNVSEETALTEGVAVEDDAGTEAETEQSREATTEDNAAMDLEAKEDSEDIYVQKVEGLSEDFIRGMDASSVFVEENSGVKYYDFDGNECDVFKILAEAGVNCIRLRVWNDPYDSEGNGYGGGNNDVETAIALGKRATEYGMQVMIDFHYSDFWADPKKQFAPKAWENMSLDDKCKALSDFTTESLNKILDAGVDVTFVQIGNEINNGMSGETTLSNIIELLDAGSTAVRAVSADRNKNLKIIVHYTNIEDGGGKVPGLVDNLEKNDIDYDIVGLSYYPYWHGDLQNMQEVVKSLKESCGKEIMLVETAYPYTTSDGDDSGNSFDGKTDLVEGYPATVQGQAHMIRDIIAAAYDAGAIGVCYWEGVWIPVGSSKNTNTSIWEMNGSGWASSYAADYDPNDAGKYYGGCSWDNQAMFDFKGYPLKSLNVFNYIYDGHTAPLKVETVPDIELSISVGEDVVLPKEAQVIYNDPTVNESIAVDWDAADLEKIDTSKAGTIALHGTLQNDEKSRVICRIDVKDDNFVLNPGFEDNDRTMWDIAYEGEVDPTDYQQKKDDAHDGEFALHFWDGVKDMDFTLSQEITGLESGTYSLSCFTQGGDVKDGAEMVLYCDVQSGTEIEHFEEPFMVTSWSQWKNPAINGIEVASETDVVTIGVHIKTNASSWGTVDDFLLKKD